MMGCLGESASPSAPLPLPQEAYDAYLKHFAEAPVHVLRDCLELASGRAPVPIEEVESAGGERGGQGGAGGAGGERGGWGGQ